LEFDKVAFGPPSGECANELVDTLITKFLNQNVEVVDRQNLQAMLNEHDFNLSGYVNANDAVQLGKIVGPAAMVFVSLTRCHIEQNQLTDTVRTKEGSRRIYISRTRGYLKGSVRVVDLRTSQYSGAQPIDEQITEENKSDEGFPEFPSEFDIKDAMLSRATLDVHKLLFPWSETRQLIFFNNKDCNLKTAFNLLRAGDIDTTLEVSLENLEACKSNPKAKPRLLSHASYNVGMTYFLRGDHDNALKYFRQASIAKSSGIVSQAMAEVSRASRLAVAMQAFDEQFALGQAAPAAQQVPQPQVPRGSAAAISSAPPRGTVGAASEDLATRLQKLDSLKKAGLIDQSDYDKKKSELLSEL